MCEFCNDKDQAGAHCVAPLRQHFCCKDEREAQYDGHGCFLAYTCPTCHEAKTATFRPDIFERYECDEPIEPEE